MPSSCGSGLFNWHGGWRNWYANGLSGACSASPSTSCSFFEPALRMFVFRFETMGCNMGSFPYETASLLNVVMVDCKLILHHGSLLSRCFPNAHSSKFHSFVLSASLDTIPSLAPYSCFSVLLSAWPSRKSTFRGT